VFKEAGSAGVVVVRRRHVDGGCAIGPVDPVAKLGGDGGENGGDPAVEEREPHEHNVGPSEQGAVINWIEANGGGKYFGGGVVVVAGRPLLATGGELDPGRLLLLPGMWWCKLFSHGGHTCVGQLI